MKEGQADVHARTSVGKALRLSISKFGVMSFTDDEDSAAAPSTMSFYEGSVNTFPLSPDAALNLQDVLSPVSAPIVVPVTSNTDENASNDDVYVVVQAAAQKETVSDNAAKDQKEGSVHTDNLTPCTPKVVLKGTPNHAPNTQKLTPGLSPMPSGNTVRRLSTLAPRGSPYTMDTKSSTTVTSPSPAMTVSSDDATTSVANAGAEVSVEGSLPVTQDAAGVAESVSEVVSHNNGATDAIASEPDATFAGTSVKQLFASVESEPVDDAVDTTNATDDNKSETAPVEEPVAAPAASPRDFRLSSGDVNGVVSDTKKLKGGKHRNANQKGRGLKM